MGEVEKGSVITLPGKGDTAASSLKTLCVPLGEDSTMRRFTVKVQRGRDQLMCVLLVGWGRGKRGGQHRNLQVPLGCALHAVGRAPLVTR